MSLRESRVVVVIATLLRRGVRFSTQATCVFRKDAAAVEGGARQGGPSLHRASRTVHAHTDSRRTLAPEQPMRSSHRWLQGA